LRNLHDCRLYGILDLGYIEAHDCLTTAERMIRGGVDLIQLRGKRVASDLLAELARDLHEITAAAETPLIINDYPQIAAEVPLEGVHLGQDDEAIGAARRHIGRPILVGKSTHTLAQARAAQADGADYIGFGPIFSTPTKPDYPAIGLTDIEQVHCDVGLPIFCIGGIKRENLERVIAAGARRVVIVSGLLQSADLVEYASTCKQLLLSAAGALSKL
jgi:thiamine-phosphate pyrophosphorylase